MRTALCIVLIAVVSSSTGLLYAADAEKEGLPEQEETTAKKTEEDIQKNLKRKISVQYEMQPISDVARHLAESGQLNIVLADSVDEDAPITLTVKDMEPGKVLEWVSRLNNLNTCKAFGGIYLANDAGLAKLKQYQSAAQKRSVPETAEAQKTLAKLQKEVSVEFEQQEATDVIREFQKITDVKVALRQNVKLDTFTLTANNITCEDWLHWLMIRTGTQYSITEKGEVVIDNFNPPAKDSKEENKDQV
jgi:hypothetical protein